jgi:hypothetical protein
MATEPRFGNIFNKFNNSHKAPYEQHVHQMYSQVAQQKAAVSKLDPKIVPMIFGNKNDLNNAVSSMDNGDIIADLSNGPECITVEIKETHYKKQNDEIWSRECRCNMKEFANSYKAHRTCSGWIKQ